MKTAWAVLTALALTVAVRGETIVVDIRGGGHPADIQQTLDAAASGDEILVRPGVYRISKPLDFNRGRDPATRGRTPPRNIVLRSEGGWKETTLRWTGETDEDRASVVVFQNGEGKTSVLEGFTIEGGEGTVRGEDRAGGGVLCVNGSAPEVRKCHFVGNRAGLGGGLFSGDGAKPTVIGCIFRANRAKRGGGLYCDSGSSITLKGCSIADNWVGNHPVAGSGGGVGSVPGASLILEDCLVWRNVAQGGAGAGVQCGGDAKLTRCSILGNLAPSGIGGGVLCWSDSVTLVDCTIWGNAASMAGGVAVGVEAKPTISHCTITGNCSEHEGGGIGGMPQASPTVESCIVWGNAGGSIGGMHEFEPRVSHSCVEAENVWPGEGNIDKDPLFVGWKTEEVYVDRSRKESGDGSRDNPYRDLDEALNFNLALSKTSPCIDAAPDGRSMGADHGVRDVTPAARRVVHLDPGTYDISGFSLANNVSLRGAGPEKTVIHGTVHGLRTGASLSGVTVTRGCYGGILVGYGEAPEIMRCVVKANVRSGLSCGVEAAPRVTNCVFSGNSAANIEPGPAGHGGGVRCEPLSSPEFVNCLIFGNAALRGGGVFCQGGCRPVFRNCTISGNRVALQRGTGAGHIQGDSGLRFVSCILWGNEPSGTCGELTHCIAQEDPLFVRDGKFDYGRSVTLKVHGLERKIPDFVVEEPDLHLRHGSPAIDKGKVEGAPEKDLAGNSRPVGARVDVGAYEYGPR